VTRSTGPDWHRGSSILHYAIQVNRHDAHGTAFAAASGLVSAELPKPLPGSLRRQVVEVSVRHPQERWFISQLFIRRRQITHFLIHS